MAHVFISYSRRDTGDVDQMMRELRRMGVDFWVDRQGIRGGDQWRQEIVNAIRGARVFMLVLSPNSAVSDNVRKEVDLAEGARRPILPIAIAPVEIPRTMQYQLAGLQIIDLSQNQRQGWQQLVQALSQHVALDPSASTGNVRISMTGRGDNHGLDLHQLGGGGLLDKLTFGNLKQLFKRK